MPMRIFSFNSIRYNLKKEDETTVSLTITFQFHKVQFKGLRQTQYAPRQLGFNSIRYNLKLKNATAGSYTIERFNSIRYNLKSLRNYIIFGKTAVSIP